MLGSFFNGNLVQYCTLICNNNGYKRKLKSLCVSFAIVNLMTVSIQSEAKFEYLRKLDQKMASNQLLRNTGEAPVLTRVPGVRAGQPSQSLESMLDSQSSAWVQGWSAIRVYNRDPKAKKHSK